VSVAKTADVIILMSKREMHAVSAGAKRVVDATKSAEQKKMLEIELDAVGIRLNTRPPDVVFKQKTAGGVSPSPCRMATSADDDRSRSTLRSK
jgi:ribosome-interacting GTPase 1